MARYSVPVVMTYYGFVEVEAENEDDAIEKVLANEFNEDTDFEETSSDIEVYEEFEVEEI